MTTVRELHDRAMELADEMLTARARGRRRQANALAVEAFEAELRAATLAFDRDTSAPTRIILLRSMASLAREARVYEAGIDLAIRALADESLREQRTEIFRIVETLRTYEHLNVEGVTLQDTDIQLTLAGPAAAPDFARSDEVLNRVEKFRLLVVRDAMRKTGLPYEKSSPRTHQFRSVFTPYLSTPRAASFAVTLKFGVDEQGELDLFRDMAAESGTKKRPPRASRVLDDVIASARAYAEGGPMGLRRVIPDESYAKNAASLLRELSPDARGIVTVGLTIVRKGRIVPVHLPERNAFDGVTPNGSAGGGAEALPPIQESVVGTLLEGNAINAERAHATVVADGGRRIKFEYDEASHGDIIDGYWKHRVRVRLRRIAARRLFLLNIDNA